MKYIARVEIGSVLEEVEFTTDENPVEYLWRTYGVSAYIESLRAVEKVVPKGD